MIRIKIFNIALALVTAFATSGAMAQERANRPLQIHVNASGLFLKTVGPGLADAEVQSLEVSDWELPGFSIGYHLSNQLYLGYSFQPNRSLVLTEEWSMGSLVNDAFISVDHNTGNFHALEARYFPFDFGLYGLGMLTHVTQAEYSMEATRLDQTMKIGINSYASDLNVDWHFKSLSTIGLGLGYNMVHKSGLSFDIGLAVPLPFSSPLYRAVTISSVQGHIIDEQDKLIATGIIQNEQFYFPVQFRFNLGFNFKTIGSK